MAAPVNKTWDTLIRSVQDSKKTKSVSLAKVPPQYFASSIRNFEKQWACGYRNIQMLLSALKESRSSNNISVLTITQIQKLIENAWSEGFDEPGAAHFKHNLVSKHDWIGATEAYVAFTALDINTKVYDFPMKTSKEQLPACERLFSFIVDYFSKDGQTYPLYVQQDRHSRTFVGVEYLEDGQIVLLAFDPGKPLRLIGNMKDSSSSSSSFSSKTKDAFIQKTVMPKFRVTMSDLKKLKEFQIVCIESDKPLTTQEKSQRKTITSSRIV